MYSFTSREHGNVNAEFGRESSGEGVLVGSSGDSLGNSLEQCSTSEYPE